MISQVTSTSTGQSLGATAGNLDQLGRETFLELLITQLKNQDPLEPMESTQFVTQLAQFSELEEMQELNEYQGTLTNLLASANNFASIGLLNKEVEFAGDTVQWTQETPAGIRFQLGSEAASVQVALLGADGSKIRTLSQGVTSAGIHSVLWDGKDEQGQEMAAGTYRCAVEARSAAGDYLPVELIQKGTVQGLEFRDGTPYLRIGDGWLAMSEVKAILN